MTTTARHESTQHLRHLANRLADYRDELADNLGTWHPLFELVDDALRSWDERRMVTARRAVERWLFRWHAPREQRWHT